jgi:hypothetical protein
MTKKFDDTEAVALIIDALQDVKTGKLSFVAFAVVVGGVVDPPEVTPQDLEWGAKKWLEIKDAAEHCAERTERYLKMTDTELLDELIRTASYPIEFGTTVKDAPLSVDGFWRGLILGVGKRRSPFAPSVKICAADLHTQQDELGYLFCHWCGRRLSA